LSIRADRRAVCSDAAAGEPGLALKLTAGRRET